MAKTLKTKSLLIYFIIMLFFYDLLLNISISSPISITSIVYMLIFNIPFGIFFYILSVLPNGKDNFKLPFFIAFTLALIFFSQHMYYRFFKTFYTVYSALNGAQVFQFREDVFAIFKKSWPWLIVFSIPPFLILFLKDRMLFCLRPRFKSFLFLILLIILINGIGLTGITLGDKGPNSPYDLYSRSGNPFLTAQRLGLLTNMRLEIQNIIFKNNSPILAAFAHYIEDSAPVDNSSDDYIHEIEVIPEDPDIPP